MININLKKVQKIKFKRNGTKIHCKKRNDELKFYKSGKRYLKNHELMFTDIYYKPIQKLKLIQDKMPEGKYLFIYDITDNKLLTTDDIKVDGIENYNPILEFSNDQTLEELIKPLSDISDYTLMFLDEDGGFVHKYRNKPDDIRTSDMYNILMVDIIRNIKICDINPSLELNQKDQLINIIECLFNNYIDNTKFNIEGASLDLPIYLKNDISEKRELFENERWYNKLLEDESYNEICTLIYTIFKNKKDLRFNPQISENVIEKYESICDYIKQILKNPIKYTRTPILQNRI